ncbi:hypothetical protein F5X96DRAFT_112490 [Biscogniauxia mediterranea]|nr:hypothetical protein F5X96DRAFT_112490 [Biscogniauxia mediterranea]
MDAFGKARSTLRRQSREFVLFCFFVLAMWNSNVPGHGTGRRLVACLIKGIEPSGFFIIFVYFTAKGPEDMLGTSIPPVWNFVKCLLSGFMLFDGSSKIGVAQLR